MIRTKADATGRFELTLAAGQRYSVQAFGSHGGAGRAGNFGQSDAVVIIAGEAPLALVVRRLP